MQETPVYQDLTWNSYSQPCKQKDYRLLEQKRNSLIQSLQQTPPNRVELERQLHAVQTEMYLYQTTQKQNHSDFSNYRSQHHSAEPPPMDSDLMDMLGLPQSGSSWNKQFIDSGIASGSTTSPPSDDGGNNDYQADIDDELAMHNIPSFDWEVPYNKTSYHGNQSRSQRLRAELFPDANEETTYQSHNSPAYQPQNSPSTPTNQSTPTNHSPTSTTLQTLGEPTSTTLPTNIAQNTIENIVHYQGDAELAMQAIPEFSKLLAGSKNNKEVQVSVTTCIHQLSKKEASMHAMLSYPQLVTSLLHTLTTSTDIEVSRCCTGTLHNLSHIREGMEAIQKFRGIPILCDLLSSSSEKILYYTITTLHNMIQRRKSSQLDICLSGGLEKMVSVLKYTDKPQFCAMVADCIHLLCHRNPEKKLAVAACNGPAQLVKILQTCNVEYLTWAVCRALKTLSVCSRNKTCIMEAGGLQALARHLDTASQRVTEEVLYTMRNLSNAVNGTGMDPIITKLMDVLARTNINLIACSVGCLSNLTCNNPNNKKTVFRAGGMDTLLRCLLHHQAIPSVAEPLLCTLRHINYKHSEYEQTQHAFRSSGGVSLITKVLSTAHHWAVIKATCGLIRNLALNTANIPFFKDTGLLLHLIQACLRITDHYKGGGPGFNEIRDGIRLDDIVWESLKILQTVSNHVEVRNQLDNPITAHLVMKCINSNNENLVEAALAIVVLFEKNENFMTLVKKDPRVELISKLCHFRNGKIAGMATVLSTRLAELESSCSLSSRSQQPTTGLSSRSQQPTTGVNEQLVIEQGGGGGGGWAQLSDVVDLDATTAQYRSDSYIRSPALYNTATIKSPAEHALHQFSARYAPPSPHAPHSTHSTQHYPGLNIPFPTTYPGGTAGPGPGYNGASSYQPFPGYPGAGAGYPPSHTNWYATM